MKYRVNRHNSGTSSRRCVRWRLRRSAQCGGESNRRSGTNMSHAKSDSHGKCVSHIPPEKWRNRVLKRIGRESSKLLAFASGRRFLTHNRVSGMWHRWILPFLIAALLLPPLPVAIGGAAPHPALLLAGAGLFAGLLSLRSWHVPADESEPRSAFLFFILLFSAAPAPYLLRPRSRSGGACARGAVRLSVYLFLLSHCRSGEDVIPPIPLSSTGSSVLRRLRVGPLCVAWISISSSLAPAGFSDQYVWLDTGVYRRAQGLVLRRQHARKFLRVLPGDDRGGADAAVRGASGLAPRAARRRSLFSAALIFSYSRALDREPAGGRRGLLALHHKRVPFGRLPRWVRWPACSSLRRARLCPALLQRLANTHATSSPPPIPSSPDACRSWRTLPDFLAANPWHALIGIGYKTLPYSDFTGGKVIADNMYLSRW